MNPIIQLKKTTSVFFVALLLASIAIPWSAQAVSPPPDGGSPGGNTAEGDFALQHLTTGTVDTALGAFALFNNTTGLQNTATGSGALFNNTEGFNNTANGAAALFSNIDGKANTAIGFAALFSDTTIDGNTGNQNTAVGNTALLNNTIGTSNTAVGSQALLNNVQANRNTAVGKDSLFSNHSASDNTAVGFQTLFSNTAGNNTAVGSGALASNVGGSFSTAVGFDADFNSNADENDAFGAGALVHVTDGGFNVGIGDGALSNVVHGSDNTAVGNSAGLPATGSHGVFIGQNAGSGVIAASNVIVIGADVTGANTDNSCFIGHIDGVTSASGVAVLINTDGKLGTTTSSRRFKDDIKPMSKASEAIFALRPVTFRYKKELDPEALQQFGLVAEDVQKVNPDLVALDKEGKPYAVRYEQVNAMLLNEFLKEHRKVEEQQATIAQLKQDFQSKFAEQQKQIKALTSGLEKVNNQLELNKPAPQMVANNQ